MKKHNYLKTTVDRYKAEGYSEKSIECLHYLESRCESLQRYLEEYRHLQPNGELFSEKVLGLIRELHDLHEIIAEQQSRIDHLQKQLDFLYRKLSLNFEASENNLEKKF